MKTKFNLLIAIGIALVVSSCGNPKKTTDSQEVAEEVKAVRIDTATAVLMDVPQTDVYTSTIQANIVNNIAPQSVSRIQKINVEVGDFVSKGQILAEMDRVQLNQARLKLANDSTEFSRIKGLYEEGGISKSDYDAVELGYKVSRSSYNNLLENTVLRAPVSGVITARNYDKGDMYSMGKPIYVLQQITPVKLLVGISESDYTVVKKGDNVSITVDAIPGETFSGRINRIYPTMDAASHTFTTEVVVNNYDRKLRPGMYARVNVSFGVNKSVVVPDNAIVKQQGSGQRFVFVVQPDGTVKSNVVKLGKHFDTSYEILEGVQDGDIIATKGSASLKDGSKVEFVKE